MKKFSIQLLLFFTVFFTVVFSITRFDNIARCHNKNANVQKLTCYASFDSLDILFMGNSYCYSGINPVYFDSAGIRSFNVGVSTCSVTYYNVLINDYLNSVKNAPKSIFMLVSPMIFSSKSDDAMSNPIFRYLNKPISFEEYILTKDPKWITSYPKIMATGISRTFVNSFNYFTTKDYCNYENNEMLKSKGFIFSDKVTNLKEELKTEHFLTPLRKNKFNTNKAAQLIKLAAQLEAKNIRVVFYELPYNKLYTYFNNAYLADYHDFVKKLSLQFTYLPVKLPLSNEYYRDQDHLNAQGASLACKEMIRIMRTDSKLNKLFWGQN